METTMDDIKGRVPWQAKLAAKLMLSRLPVGYPFWKRLGLFELGKMDQPVYAYGVFRKHFDRVDFPRRNGGFVGLELGPGDSLFSAIVAYAFKASAYYLVDVGSFARRDLESYRAMAAFLADKGYSVPDLAKIDSLEELLAVCGARYGTSGLSSLRRIPDKTVDFLWSHVVLQSIRRAQFLDTLRELRRVMRADGVCSHTVDLSDTVSGGLNNLRFPEHIWESNLIANSGFYTNRIRYSEMLQLFKEAGFEVESVVEERWNKLPTPKAKLSAGFENVPDSELRVSGFDVTLRPA